MLVVHPQDPTTAMLRALYENTGAKTLDQNTTSEGIKHALNHVSRSERVLLLGHGSDQGLFAKTQENLKENDRIIVGKPHAYYLRRHGANIVGMWCHANLFAQQYGLHGLFTGMIVSEMGEAEEYGIRTTQEELDRENAKIAQRLRLLLDDEETMLCDIPQKMQAWDDAHTFLTEFNYAHFHYL